MQLLQTLVEIRRLLCKKSDSWIDNQSIVSAKIYSGMICASSCIMDKVDNYSIIHQRGFIVEIYIHVSYRRDANEKKIKLPVGKHENVKTILNSRLIVIRDTARCMGGASHFFIIFGGGADVDHEKI